MNELRAISGMKPLACVCALVLGFLASWRLQLQSGTIGMFHDWSIAPSAAQNAAYAAQLFNGWYRWELGEPVFFPTEYPLRFAFGFLGVLGLGGDAVSHAFVFLVPAAAFLCTWIYVRRLTGSNVGAFAAGVFYALNPVMLNKLVSGQASYVVGYAAIPLALWACERALYRPAARNVALFGGILALCAVQLQLGLVAVFLTALTSVLPRNDVPFGRRSAVFLIGCGVAALIHLPTFIGAGGGAAGYENRAQFANSNAYLLMNSVAFPQAVRLLGYLTRYAEIAVQQSALLWNAAMVAVLIAVAVGIAVSTFRFRMFAALSLLCAFILMAGTKSPLGGGMQWLFTHVRYVEVFRELYHLMAVPALVYACALGFFCKFVEGKRAKVLVYPALCLALVFVCAPMLSGDGAGWMRAFPLMSAYGDVLHDQMQGSARVLWLPMDQPLSFDNQGAGVDPMAVTARGSLWDYALNWPLTAVDSDIHNGGDLLTALRALSVGTVVKRDRMRSELARFTVDGLDTLPFLSRNVPIDLAPSNRYRSSHALTVPNAIGFLSHPQQIALVPARLSACAPAIVAGYAPVTFGAKMPALRQYAVIYDPGDAAGESLQMAGALAAFPSTSIDAHLGFAPVSAWWWYRREYADAANVTIAFGKQHVAIGVKQRIIDARAVVAWIAVPNGGRVRISVPGRAVTLDTRGSGEWASRAIPLGALRPEVPVTVTTTDNGAEVALRGLSIVSAADYRQMRGAWRSIVARANPQIATTTPGRESFVRAGNGRSIGYVANGVQYRLQLSGAAARGALKSADGYPLAVIRDGSATFYGDAQTAIVSGPNGNDAWTLHRVRVQPLRLPKPRPGGSPKLTLWNWTYTTGWRTASPAASFPSAIGTTIFAGPQPLRQGQIWLVKTIPFQFSYVVGTAVLIISLCAGLGQNERNRLRTVEESDHDVPEASV